MEDTDYKPVDGDVLIRIEGEYYIAYKRTSGKWVWRCLGPVEDKGLAQHWIKKYKLTCRKSTLAVFHDVLCGFYRPIEQKGV